MKRTNITEHKKNPVLIEYIFFRINLNILN